MKRILLFGASGSIGGSTLSILRERPDEFRLAGLSVHRNTARLAEWVDEFAPEKVLISDGEARESWAAAHPGMAAKLLPAGTAPTGLLELAADRVLNGILGFAGLEVTLAALEAGLDVALANKESLVCGGELLRKRQREGGGRLLPVDSEHSALFQLLEGRPRDGIRRVWLTASGGPFRDATPGELVAVTPEQALRHPTWEMGPKITVDSATLMNKGLEVIEASLLFDIPADHIGVLIHPSSTVHALLEMADSSVFSQMALPDMRQPILHALAHPERPSSDYGRVDFTHPFELAFEPVDAERFPAVELAREALRRGGTSPLALNAADEIGVAAFLAGTLSFPGIVELVAAVLGCEDWGAARDYTDLVEADRRARELARGRLVAAKR